MIASPMKRKNRQLEFTEEVLVFRGKTRRAALMSDRALAKSAKMEQIPRIFFLVDVGGNVKYSVPSSDRGTW